MIRFDACQGPVSQNWLKNVHIECFMDVTSLLTCEVVGERHMDKPRKLLAASSKSHAQAKTEVLRRDKELIETRAAPFMNSNDWVHPLGAQFLAEDRAARDV